MVILYERDLTALTNKLMNKAMTNDTERNPFFSPLNIASLIFIIYISHIAIQFNRHGGENQGISHEQMAKGDGSSFVSSASERLPFGFYEQFSDIYCREIAFEDGSIVFKCYSASNPQRTTFDKSKANIYFIAKDLYIRYIEYTGITNRCTNQSKVLDAILSRNYPIKIKLYKRRGEPYQIDPEAPLDEFVVTADDYIPIWKGLGLKSKYFKDNDVF